MKIFLSVCFLAVVMFNCFGHAGQGEPKAVKKVQKSQSCDLTAIQNRILDVIEKRFISPEGVLYDYAGLNGEVILPTPEECALNKPNALAWNTPIENGGFFNGLLLVGLVDLWETQPSEKIAKMARTMVKGLYVLQDKSPVPGCILRGIGKDGCFYPASSTDQVIPWLLGLWVYSKSSLATDAERKECRKRCYALVKALEKNNWIIPGTKEGFSRGNLVSYSPINNCALVLAAMVLDEMESTDHHLNAVLNKKRIDSIFTGYPKIRARECWYASHNFYIMRMLAEQTKDKALRAKIYHGLNVTAAALPTGISLWKKHVRGLKFSPDWHSLNRVWFEQKNSKEAQACSNPQWQIWNETSPAVMNERHSIMFGLSSAWILLMAEDKALVEANKSAILEMLNGIPYEELYYVPFFYAINVIAELSKK